MPPTVVGFQPPTIAVNQNQPNEFQNQPNQTPPKSSIKKFVIIGGIFGLLIFAVSGFALWRNVIEPYRYEQWRLKTETDNQNRANTTTAASLLPAELGFYGNFYKRKETFDKLQMMQAEQTMPNALKEKISQVDDAAATLFVSEKNEKQRVLLQIFKLKTPQQAKTVCLEMIDEVEKKRERIKDIRKFPNSIRENYCTLSVEGNNNEKIYVMSLYGFLYVASGSKEAPVGEAVEKASKPLDP